MRTWLLLLWCCFTSLAQAATYTYRTDAFAWETAANVVSWARTCTSYPGDDDQSTINFTGGFTFRFAGVNHSSVRVLSNGMLQFGTDTGFFRNYGNTTLPAGAAGAFPGCAAGPTTNVMMAYWTDLNPGQAGSGNVTWQQKGTAPNRYVVVSWNSVYQYATSTPYAVQIILYENGEFKYQYGNSNASGSNATIGVQVSATDYTLYSYNSGYNANGSAIRWFIPSGTPTRVAEYRFDELSWNGTTGEVRDSSGNGYNGVRISPATNSASGYICRTLDVPANTTSASAAVDSAVDVDTTLGALGTMSFWFNSNAAWNSGAAMLMDATTTANRPLMLWRMANGALRLTVADSAGTLVTATSAAQSIGAGVWTHIAATWSLRSGNNQSVLRLYINGSQVAITTTTSTGAPDPSQASLFIGDNRSAASSTYGTYNSANGRIDEMRLYNFELSPAEIAQDIAQSHSCTTPLHHLELRHSSGTGLTCTPSTLTIAACQDAACSVAFTGGVTATLTSGAGVVWPDGSTVTIPSGASTVTRRVQLTTPGSVTLGLSGASPAPANATTCNFGTPSCSYTAADSGLVLTAGNQIAESAGNNVTISAVKKADNSLQCVPAFTGARTITLGCAYLNPTSGTLPVRVGGTAVNATGNAAAACDAGGRPVSLTFDATGTATAALAYADVGQVQLSASYAGSAATTDTGLVMSGNTSFIAAPASFEFSGVTGGTIKAGTAFAATVRARNSAGSTTPNFGRETTPQTPTLSMVRFAPTGAGASNGVFTGSLGAFSAGSATASNLLWSEVGQIDLKADLASYLGTAWPVTGSTGTAGTVVGRFIPHHFDVTATPACGSFSYADQPFSVSVSAMNGLATPTRTVNYNGTSATTPQFARTVTLSDANALGLGSFGATSAVAATRFNAGLASATGSNAVTYSYTSKPGAPGSLKLRAIDTDSVSSSGFAEALMPLRNGRLWLSNAFGSEKTPLSMAVQAQYWTGRAWVLNNLDSCTTVPAAAVVRSGTLNYQGAAAAWTTAPSAITVTGGNGTLVLAAPSPAGSTGTVDIALNLGATTTDLSCLGAHPASTGATLPWLRSRNGSCASTWDRDPAARASFGIAVPETRKTIHVRELF